MSVPKITRPLDMARLDGEMVRDLINLRLRLYVDDAEREARAEFGLKPKSRLHRGLQRLVNRIP